MPGNTGTRGVVRASLGRSLEGKALSFPGALSRRVPTQLRTSEQRYAKLIVSRVFGLDESPSIVELRLYCNIFAFFLVLPTQNLRVYIKITNFKSSSVCHAKYERQCTSISASLSGVSTSWTCGTRVLMNEKCSSTHSGSGLTFLITHLLHSGIRYLENNKTLDSDHQPLDHSCVRDITYCPYKSQYSH